MTKYDLSSRETQEALRLALKSQYRAALDMLREAIDRCPDELWLSGASSPFWWTAYHVLYYTHLYVQPSSGDFCPWQLHRSGIADMDEPIDSFRPDTRSEILDYWRILSELIEPTVDRLDLLDTESGFDWKKMPRTEHQIANLRHIQHHTAQLTDRLRGATNTSVARVTRPRGDRAGET